MDSSYMVLHWINIETMDRKRWCKSYESNYGMLSSTSCSLSNSFGMKHMHECFVQQTISLLLNVSWTANDQPLAEHVTNTAFKHHGWSSRSSAIGVVWAVGCLGRNRSTFFCRLMLKWHEVVPLVHIVHTYLAPQPKNIAGAVWNMRELSKIWQECLIRHRRAP